MQGRQANGVETRQHETAPLRQRLRRLADINDFIIIGSYQSRLKLHELPLPYCIRIFAISPLRARSTAEIAASTSAAQVR